MDVGDTLSLLRTTDGFSPSERKVADAVLADPERAVRLTLAELAVAAAVSEPTVVRFCRRIGHDGYQDYKLGLARSLVTRSGYADLEVKPDDPIRAVAHKIVDATVDVLGHVRRTLDTDALAAAVELLAGAHKIEFYGMGASGAVALDAHHKFFRLVVPCVAYVDAHMQFMSAATLAPGDVVVAISHTGRTRELIESAELARRQGASVIAITASDTPLARLASLALTVDVPEDTDVFTPMFSRLAHLVILDVLAVGMAMRGGEATRARLARMKASLRAKRAPREADGGTA